MEETFAAQIVPEILLAHNGYDVLKEYDMAYPLDDLIEANDYDPNLFRDGLVDVARSHDPNGEDKLYGLPFEDMPFGLYFNPEIFDLFGVGYPHDGMTWDEVLDLAKQVSGEISGVDYRISSLPGNEEEITGSFVEGNIAMTVNQLTGISDYAKAEMGEFGIVSLLVWPNLPDSAPYKFIGQTLAIS